MHNRQTSALLLVDLQNDFFNGGVLAVPFGEEVIPLANRLQGEFAWVVATQDWHPAGHESFASAHRGKKPGDVIDLHGVRQVLWPDHCIQGTRGAGFHPDFQTSGVSHVVFKGTDSEVDSYSAFFDNARRHDTGLADWLQARGITDIHVMGLATDYCVKFTCLDGLRLGFQVYLIQEGCRGVDLNPGDSDAAIHEMQARGVNICTDHG